MRAESPAAARSPGGDGMWCAICAAPTEFIAHGDWLRDHLVCPRCGSIPRQRALVEVLDTVRPDWRALTIHESSPSIWVFRDQCPGYSFSYFFEDVPRGGERDGMRCEDIEAMTFPDESFDLFVTQDVLEHVFNPDAAIRDIMRVLKPGGMHVFTAPRFPQLAESTRRAALVDGAVEHLVEPMYHGNPISDEGALVTWDYGSDFESLLEAWSGYYTSTYVLRDRRRGLEGAMLDVFVTIKDEGNRIRQS